MRSSRARVAERSPTYALRICYVESSARLAGLLEGDVDVLESVRSAATKRLANLRRR